MTLSPTDEVVTLASDLREFYRLVEIAIKQCRNGGIDCKIHGLQVTDTSSKGVCNISQLLFIISQVVGRKKAKGQGGGQDSNTAGSVGFLASDSEEYDEPVNNMTKQQKTTMSTSSLTSSSSDAFPLAATCSKPSLHKVFVWGLNDKDQVSYRQS